ncbi:MAG: hypothetical protein EBR35_05155 [Flavobacteriales bacterium]|nr:hypothetical protein [Flavobacteriales bacterium]
MNEQVTTNVGFDIVIGNPPYFQIREVDEQLQEQYKQSKFYEFAKGGRMNVFQFFVPLAIHYARTNGIICLITQNSILAEDTAIVNRKYIFENTQVIRFDSYPERDNIKRRVFESAKMSVAISLLKKSIANDNKFKIIVWKERQMINKTSLEITKKEVFKLFNDTFIIPIASQTTINILKKVKFNSNAFFIKCSAGEIDMSAYRTKFNNVKNGLRVFTGAQIQRYITTKNPSQGEVIYLPKEYKPTTPKARAANSERVVMQRITGVDSRLRLIMAIVGSNNLCSNSVNFIVDENKNKLRFILGIFNSTLINSYFKFTSTNTNITTSEIERIPIPKCNIKIINIISENVTQIHTLKSEDKPTAALEQEIDNLVYKLYELTYDEVKVIDPAFSLSKKEYEAIKLE